MGSHRGSHRIPVSAREGEFHRDRGERRQTERDGAGRESPELRRKRTPWGSVGDGVFREGTDDVLERVKALGYVQ
jgi:hypothetical protein